MPSYDRTYYPMRSHEPDEQRSSVYSPSIEMLKFGQKLTRAEIELTENPERYILSKAVARKLPIEPFSFVEIFQKAMSVWNTDGKTKYASPLQGIGDCIPSFELKKDWNKILR